MLTHQWPKISSDFICNYKKLLAAGALPQTLLGELTVLPESPCWTPMARGCCARPLSLMPSALILDCGAQITVTLRLGPGFRVMVSDHVADL